MKETIEKTPNGLVSNLANPDINYRVKSYSLVHAISNYISKLTADPIFT